MFWDSKFWTLQMDSFTTNNGNDFFHFSFAPGLILYARNNIWGLTVNIKMYVREI